MSVDRLYEKNVAISGIGTGSGQVIAGFTGKGFGNSVGLCSAFGCSRISVTIRAVAFCTASRVGACVTSLAIIGS